MVLSYFICYTFCVLVGSPFSALQCWCFTGFSFLIPTLSSPHKLSQKQLKLLYMLISLKAYLQGSPLLLTFISRCLLDMSNWLFYKHMNPSSFLPHTCIPLVHSSHCATNIYSIRNMMVDFIKSLQIINAGEGVEKRELFYTVGGNG